MASATVKKPCTKCSKGAGVMTCYGCQQSCCLKHFFEHRQEMSYEMDNVGQEHDLLQQDLGQQNAKHPIFLQINTWEREAISKIQVAAEAARADLRELFDRNKRELKKSVTELTNELQSCREADDYTEIDINKWTQQLQALRKTLESPSTIRIAENETPQSTIRLISIHNQQHRGPTYASKCLQYLSSANERFDDVVGTAIVSEEGFMVTCTSSIILAPTIYGRNSYSSGLHRIHFRIEQIGEYRIFLGISSFSEKMRHAIVRNQSRYGWWDLNAVIVNNEVREKTDNRVVKTGDEMTLTLDCDTRQIQLQHHRTNQLVQLSIDLNTCPLPWKVAVKLQMNGDAIRILQ